MIFSSSTSMKIDAFFYWQIKKKFKKSLDKTVCTS